MLYLLQDLGSTLRSLKEGKTKVVEGGFFCCIILAQVAYLQKAIIHHAHFTY